MSKKVWLSLLAAGVLVAGVFFGISAVKTVSADATPITGMYGMMERGRGGYGVTQEGLAEALGVTVDELQAAYQTATDKALEQAVAADLITQTQADFIKERGTGFFGMHLGGFMSAGDIDFQALLADALGISTDEFQAAITTARTTAIADAVAAGDLTQEQADLILGQHALRNSDAFKTGMTAAYEQAINDALEAGTITQAQADALLDNLETNGFMGGRGFGMGGGMRGGHGGMRGGMGGNW
ncbi:MAG: hypothetical protein D9V45_14060 [Chloroflexi bacterium]|nr:MAG: hypothetical protein D9V45_14060 [Chloroflexota bacterium]